tara:strand:- start:2489 stop:2881 length:393 start_codon:yes stop_codon:yes gene_type:complete
MVDIPNYLRENNQIQGPIEEPVQTSTATVVESQMVFGEWNANNPAMDYMYRAISDTLKQGAGLVQDIMQINHKKAMLKRELDLAEAKKAYKTTMGTMGVMNEMYNDPGYLATFRDMMFQLGGWHSAGGNR